MISIKEEINMPNILELTINSLLAILIHYKVPYYY